MDSKIVLAVLGAAALGFIGIMMLMPEERDDGIARLPWLVAVDALGRTQVFGFTIGETTLADIQEIFAEDGEIELFSRPATDARYAVEAYFERIYLNRLRADFIFTIDADQTMLEAMFERGLRISQLGSGDKRVKLTPADVERLARMPIRAITYLPWKSLDTEILQSRFGEPEQRIAEESGVSHWLYPEKGMDIALDANGGVVIQYVNPTEVERMLAPLQPTAEPPQRPAVAPGS